MDCLIYDSDVTQDQLLADPRHIDIPEFPDYKLTFCTDKFASYFWGLTSIRVFDFTLILSKNQS